jgi:hypothetical protein
MEPSLDIEDDLKEKLRWGGTLGDYSAYSLITVVQTA